MVSGGQRSKHTVSVRGHAARNAKQKCSSHPGEDDPMDIGAFGKGKGKQSKGNHGKGKDKGKQGQQGQQNKQGQQGQGRQGQDKSKDSMEYWNCGKHGHLSKDCWSKNDNLGKRKHQKVTTDAHNLVSKKPEDRNNEPEVEIGGFHMCSLEAADEMRESEWIKMELTLLQERRLVPRLSHAGRRSLVKVICFRTATEELVKSNKKLYVDCL